MTSGKGTKDVEVDQPVNRRAKEMMRGLRTDDAAEKDCAEGIEIWQLSECGETLGRVRVVVPVNHAQRVSAIGVPRPSVT